MRKILGIILILLTTSCMKVIPGDVTCRVTLQAQLPSGENIVALQVDNSLPGNLIKNINTGETYPIPVFVNGQCEMDVLKGVYIISFDGVAALSSGKGYKVRCTEHTTILTAVSLVEDSSNVILKLQVMQ